MTRHFTSSSPAGHDKAVKTRGLTIAGLAIVAATYGLARYCFGLFLPEFRQEFNLSTETVGLIAGLSYAGYLMATFLGSGLSTMFGPQAIVEPASTWNYQGWYRDSQGPCGTGFNLTNGLSVTWR